MTTSLHVRVPKVPPGAAAIHLSGLVQSDSRATGAAASVLMLTQVYTPDEASVGQLLDDVAHTIIAKGRTVQVITSDRGYDEPRRRFPPLENRSGISVRRTFAPGAPKRRFLHRILAGTVFLLGASWHALRAPRFDVLLVSTSPPMAPLVGILLARLRRAWCVVWLTDINPDEAVAAGVVARGSLIERFARHWTRWTLRHANLIITLDEQMKQRALDDGALPEQLRVIPPWSSIMHAAPRDDVHSFRQSQGWEGRRVIMHAGNHSPVHPLDTLLQAATARPVDMLRFAFVGGGGMKHRIDALQRANIDSLPYQPRESLPVLLSAADVHVVSMGDAMHGIVHPSKFYGAIAAGRPILLLGSGTSVLGRLVREHGIGWVVDHGDIAGMNTVLDEIARLTQDQLDAIGAKALAVHRRFFDAERIRGRFADAVLHRNAE